jgi:hypothetical protein
MKHIKLFENHSDLYSKISIDEYERMIGVIPDNMYPDGYSTWDEEYVYDNWEEFTEEELEYLPFCSGIKDVGYKSGGQVIKFGYSFPEAYIEIHPPILSKFSGIDVCKLKDEWYYVYYPKTGICYKCDQLDGLISCINKIFR